MKNLKEVVEEVTGEKLEEVMDLDGELTERDYTAQCNKEETVFIESVLGADIYEDEDEENVIGFYVTRENGEIKNYFKIV